MKVLVIAPSWIGDLVMSQTLYKEILKLDPLAKIYVLAPKWCLDVLTRMPEVTQTIEMPIGHGNFAFFERYAIGKELRKYQFNKAIILPNSWKSALIPFFAKIPQRFGFKGEERYWLINNLRKNKKDFPLLIERYSALAYSKDEIKTSKDLPQLSKPLLNTQNLTDNDFQKYSITNHENLIGICPGAEFGKAKKWSPEYYAQVICHYLKKNVATNVLIFGSKKDSETANELISFIPQELKDRVISLTGKTSITEAIDLIACCKLIICNDSGLMHIAAAVNTKIVAIFGSTSTKYTPPLSDKAIIVESNEPCHPCFKRTCKFNTYKCLAEITPVTVIKKIENTWSEI